MDHQVKIIHKKWLTHNVMQLRLEKPEKYSFEAGQALEATIDHPEFKDYKSPFTLTCLNDQDFLELTIKVYPKHEGLTLALSKLYEGDHFTISAPFDTFKNQGAGVFIAGGTGVTPFIALLRQMYKDHKIGGSSLFFANKTEKDIFLNDEFNKMLGDNFVNILSQEKKAPYLHGKIDTAFLKKHLADFKQPFYLCGPENFAEDIQKSLRELGAGEELIQVSL